MILVYSKLSNAKNGQKIIIQIMLNICKKPRSDHLNLIFILGKNGPGSYHIGLNHVKPIKWKSRYQQKSLCKPGHPKAGRKSNPVAYKNPGVGTSRHLARKKPAKYNALPSIKYFEINMFQKSIDGS